MTEFTTWRSLVDGNTITAIPDSGAYLLDDWDDNDFQRPREDEADGSYTQADGTTLDSARYRPNYDIVDGSSDMTGIEVKNQQLEITMDEDSGFGPSDAFVTQSEITIGSWSFDMRVPTYYTGGGNHSVHVILISDTDSNNDNNAREGNRWLFSFADDNGGISLVKIENGDETVVIDGGVHFDDGNEHTVEITRDNNDNWEMFLDGEQLGSASDSFLPDAIYTMINAKANDGRGLAEAEIDNLRYGDID